MKPNPPIQKPTLIEISKQKNNRLAPNINTTYDCMAPPNPKPTKPRSKTIHV